MFVARVVGTVWSTVKWPQIDGLKLLAVQPYHLADLTAEPRKPSNGDLVICADTLDAGVGDDVVVAYGHAARVAISRNLGRDKKPSVAIDAAIVAVVDDFEVDKRAVDEARELARSRGLGEQA